MPTALVTGPNYFTLLTCFDVGSGINSYLTHICITHICMGELTVGGVGGVLASLYYGARVLGQLIVPPCTQVAISKAISST